MAEFIPIRTVQDKLDSISIVNGQVIFVVDTKKIFIDIDESTRKEIGGIEGVDFLSKVDPVATGSFGLNYDENYTLGGGSVAAGDSTIAEAECSFAFGSHTYAASQILQEKISLLLIGKVILIQKVRLQMEKGMF